MVYNEARYIVVDLKLHGIIVNDGSFRSNSFAFFIRTMTLYCVAKIHQVLWKLYNVLLLSSLQKQAITSPIKKKM